MLDRPLFLIGYMACGKTTLGHALHLVTGIEFIDLDNEVERRAGMSVSDYFATYGEAAFRRLEADVLTELCAAPRPAIIACGGGTPCNEANIAMMLDHGRVVWLRAEDDITVRRLLDAPGKRPLADGKDADGLRRMLAEGMAARARWYSRAHATFDSSRLDTPGQIDESVNQFINTFLS